MTTQDLSIRTLDNLREHEESGETVEGYIEARTKLGRRQNGGDVR